MLGDEVHPEPTFAEILNGGAEMIDLVVNDKETVMSLVESVEFAMFVRILGIIAPESLLHVTGTMDVTDVTVDGDGCRCADTHALENVGIDIVIDEDDSARCLAEEGFDQNIGIEHLSFEKDAELLLEATVIHSVQYLINAHIGFVESLI